MAKENVSVSGKELAWYISGGTIALAGFALIIVSLIENLANSVILRQADAKIAEALKWSTGDWGFFRIMGLILFAVGIAWFVISLAVNAKKADRAGEKSQRRASRHGAINLEAMEAANAPKTGEATPVEQPKAE